MFIGSFSRTKQGPPQQCHKENGTYRSVLNFHATVGVVDRLDKAHCKAGEEFPDLDLGNTRHSIDGISLDLVLASANTINVEHKIAQYIQKFQTR